MKRLSIALLFGFLSIFATIVPVAFASARPSATYQFLIGTGPLCSVPGVENPCPDIAMADNGDMVEVTGQGTLSVHPNTVTGNGTFVHKAPDGSVRAMGTWTPMRLMSFKSFGTSEPFPANFLGGKALMLVQLYVGGNPVHTAVLTVICEIGKTPHGLMEGVKLAVQETPFNFHEQVSGITLFISQA